MCWIEKMCLRKVVSICCLSSISLHHTFCITSAHLRSPPVLRNRKLNDRVCQSVWSGHDRQISHLQHPFLICNIIRSAVLEEIWKRFRGLRYVFFPLSSSRCNNISFGLPVCEIPTGACWRRRTGAHQERVSYSKWKVVRSCFGRLREGLGVFWVLPWSWEAMWCRYWRCKILRLGGWRKRWVIA